MNLAGKFWRRFGDLCEALGVWAYGRCEEVQCMVSEQW